MAIQSVRTPKPHEYIRNVHLRKHCPCQPWHWRNAASWHHFKSGPVQNPHDQRSSTTQKQWNENWTQLQRPSPPLATCFVHSMYVRKSLKSNAMATRKPQFHTLSPTRKPAVQELTNHRPLAARPHCPNTRPIQARQFCYICTSNWHGKPVAEMAWSKKYRFTLPLT